MTQRPISRRDILKSLTIGIAAGSMLEAIPLEAAQHAHYLVSQEKAQAAGGEYTPKFFTKQQYKTLCALCQAIIPPDQETGGAIEAEAPEFIDLLTSENPEYQATLGGGITWLDASCAQRYGKAFLDCSAQQQTDMLDRIAYRKNADSDPSLEKAVDFFSFLRNLTADGFFTSEIGIKYLGYVGNKHVKEFLGCPPVPGV